VSLSEDRHAIADLLFEYAARVDAGDFAGVGELFAAATYRTEGSPVVLSGSDAVREAQESVIRLYDGSPRTHHVVTNVRVTVASDAASASGTSYFTVLFAAPGDGPEVILSGRYSDTFERSGGSWRFSDRLIHLDQVGDLTGHLHVERLQLG
jgi:3-phenylpropionate/cinnamic acid dioxygenase small subunit